MMFVAIFATFLLVVLFAAVTSVRADVIRPNIDTKLISVSAGPVEYDASSGVLSIDDETGVFSFRDHGGSVPHFIFNLDNDFGGAYQLSALFDTTGTNAALDGLFTGLGGDDNDLVITGKIPSLSITPEDGFSGTLLTANVLVGELFGYATTNTSAEYNLHLVVTGGDLVSAGHYSVGDALGELSVLLMLDPNLPSGFDFKSDFEATLQSGSLGHVIPEPTTWLLLGTAAPVFIWRRRKRQSMS